MYVQYIFGWFISTYLQVSLTLKDVLYLERPETNKTFKIIVQIYDIVSK